jgi:RHS repeat-associated protein
LFSRTEAHIQKVRLVCAANAQGNCTSVFSNIALGTAVSFPTDPTITSIADDPTGVSVTKVKAAHITELRTAVNAVRSLAGLAAGQWTNQTLTATVTVISADDVRDLRTKMDEALTALGIQTSNYDDQTLAGAPNGTVIKKVHITQLRQRSTSGTGGSGGSSSTQFGVQWLVADQLGTPRMVFDDTGSLANVKRHDYLPFGEDLLAGARATTPAYGVADDVRQKFTQQERDNETGLDYFISRYYSSTQGRFTGADSVGGRVNNPQTLNRYAYVSNNPLKYIDPTGNQQSIQELQKQKPQDPEPKPEKPDVPINILQIDLGGFSSVKITYLGIAPEPPDLRFFSQGQGELAGSIGELRASIPGWLKTASRHFFAPAKFLSNRLPDGVTLSGSAFFVFSGHITVTSDLHVLGGFSTPNVAEIIRVGATNAILKAAVPLSGSIVGTHILGPTTSDQRDSFFGGTAYNVGGCYGGCLGVSVSGNRVGVSGGYGTPGIDIGASRAWPLLNIPHPTFDQMQQRLNEFLKDY